MSDRTPRQGPDGAGAATSPALVRAATQSLQDRRDPRWVEISDRVLARALRATRRSPLIRARSASGVVHVSEQVLVAYIRDAVDGVVPDAALLHVRTDLVGGDTLTGVTLSLVARYGVELLPAADEIRRLTAACLVEVLGPVDVPVGLDLLHVHFADVIVGDPSHSGPWADPARGPDGPTR